MTAKYGKNYFYYKLDDGNNLIKTEIIKHIEGRMKSDSSRFPRKIDAITLEHIEYFFCIDVF